MYNLKLDHLIEANVTALVEETLQAQNPRCYREGEERILSYYLTPDGSYTCGIGCALPDRILLPLQGLTFEILDLVGVLFRTDIPYSALWMLEQLHGAWVNDENVADTPQKLRKVMTEVLGLSPAAKIDEVVYRAFLIRLQATRSRGWLWRQ